MSEACLELFKDKQLVDIGDLEQGLATGINHKGNKIKAKKILSSMLGHFTG
jgi:hypothetical protein